MEAVKVLVENGTDIHLGSGEYEFYTCPVGAAISSGKIDIVKYFINQEVEINEFLPIWYLDYRDTEMFHFLMQHEMDVNAIRLMDTEWEISRLGFALNNNQTELAEFLLKNGAQIDKSTVMDIDEVEDITFLANAGFDFSGINNQTQGAIGDPTVYSILSGKEKEVVSAFLKNGLKPTPNTIATLFPGNESDNKGYEIFEMVIKHVTSNDSVFDLNQTYSFGRSVVTWEIPINTTKTTLLGLAAWAERPSAISILMKYGARPDVKDNSGKLPAEYTDNPDIKKMLE